MANNTTIQIKRSASAGVAPTNLLANGEIAVNLLDKRIFTTDTTGGAVFDAFQNTAANIALTGTAVALKIGNTTINAFCNSSILTFSNSTILTSLTRDTLSLSNTTSNTIANNTTLLIQTNTTVNSIITASNVTTGNVFANFYRTGNIVSADQLGSGANTTNFLRGDLTWTTPTATATPGGANTQIQFNDSGVMGGNVNFTFDKTTANVVVGNSTAGQITVGTGTAIGTFTNTTLLIASNSTVNAIITNANASFNNSTSVAFMNPIGVFLGTGTANAFLNTNSLVIQSNSTINAVINTTALTLPIGNTSGGSVAAPADNNISIFCISRAGREQLSYVGSGNTPTIIQSHLMHRQLSYLLPVPAGTTASVLRATSANTVAFTARTPASTNTFLSAFRVAQTTGTTAGTSISWRNNVLQWWRGNAAGLGGFYAVARFGVAIPTTNGRAFIGFKNSATILANGNPSAQTNIIGFGWDSAQTTLRVISANSTAANTIDLGSGFPVNVGNTDWYEAVIYSPPNAGTCQYQVTNLKNGNTTFGSFNQTNLPTSTTFLTWQFWGNNGSDAAAEVIDWGGVTIETGF